MKFDKSSVNSNIAKAGAFCRLIKIEHSVFALPFAYSGAFIAAGELNAGFEVQAFLLLTLAMVAIRSFAMAFNRLVDLPFDRQNPRTAKWPLVCGEISLREAKIFSLACALIFVLSCAAINWLCLALSPLALFLTAVYSYTKRYTWLCHFVLGGAIGLAPLAGWFSVQPGFALEPLFLAFAVLFWVGGFDILYSCQDLAIDEKLGLQSVPVRFGIAGALLLAAFSHVNVLLFLFLTGLSAGLSYGWYLALAASACLLYWEHHVLSADNLQKLRFAFALNGPVSILLLLGTLSGVYL